MELSALLHKLVAGTDGGALEHADVERLRERHPAWRLLRAGNAPLVLTFLGRFFVEDNNGATSGPDLTTALDDDLYALNAGRPGQAALP